MKKVMIGMGTCGLSAGARKVHERLLVLAENNPTACEVAITGCIGMCYREPLVEVQEDGARYIYGDVDADKMNRIFEEHVLVGRIPDDVSIVYSEQADGTSGGEEKDFLDLQHRIVLQHCGIINPESMADYVAVDGYKALRHALTAMQPEDIIQAMKDSGLRGRGGAGFPTGLKWSFAAANTGEKKYVVCNADEGDPGAFMDRSVLESDPHAVLEGMIICAAAIGGTHGYIYCRAEYPLAIHRLHLALQDARESGFLGDNIMGTGFNFDIKIKQGAGAFVCGEETALFASIEGQRGMPRIRPPFPAEKGLWQQPTNNNNVETYANVPWIIRHGAERFAELGTEKSQGTKVFALAGNVVRGGLVEVPMGTTIRDLVLRIGGGIKENRAFKAVQMGGPSGGCIPASLDETCVDFESIPATGAIMGSGGMIVLDDTSCMVEIARYFLNFTQQESCGKCTFCRIGTLRMLEILERITRGEGLASDPDKLLLLAEQIKSGSLCALGQTAPNPVLTTMRHYRDEYDAHIEQHVCPAGVCNALVDFFIDPEKCTGCTLCARQCPVQAISGKVRERHVIDTVICAKCGKCLSACNFSAIYKG